MTGRIALFGGVYSNHVALRAALEDAGSRGADTIYCLGDLGAFGPCPDKTIALLRESGVRVMRGNYDDSIGRGLDDCQCGYTDPRDNHFARISYRYTFEKTSPENRRWLAELPPSFRFELGGKKVLLCHGSPRRMNEFLFESTTPTHLLAKLCRDFDCDVLAGTHTGLPWTRDLPEDRLFVNVGVLGRPQNDGTTDVWYALLSADTGGHGVTSELVPLRYDHEELAREMESERLPDEFVETIRSGYWTTCLEVLPMKERRRGRY
jgi:predicted phosphodiesterase